MIPNTAEDPVATRRIEIAPGFAGYLALPPAGRGPALLLMQEIFGINAHIRAVARQWALGGFVVLAPDLFHRQAAGVELGYSGEDHARGMALHQAYTHEQQLEDVAAALQALRALPETAGQRCGALGYCMGGRLAYFAAATAGVDAAVAYYGGRIQDHLALASQVRSPIQFHYAGADDYIPDAAVQAVRAAFAGHAGAEFHVYPGTPHGFNCWARESYQPAAAALAHGRALQFLAAALY
ncbi:carboxymethylenebutenolidase [Rubrivivax gelatinosus]|nr:carboxymethylenebutenolidase [Rubrivivax gelatinosus]